MWVSKCGFPKDEINLNRGLPFCVSILTEQVSSVHDRRLGGTHTDSRSVPGFSFVFKQTRHDCPTLTHDLVSVLFVYYDPWTWRREWAISSSISYPGGLGYILKLEVWFADRIIMWYMSDRYCASVLIGYCSFRLQSWWFTVHGQWNWGPPSNKNTLPRIYSYILWVEIWVLHDPTLDPG
jgi:hypothetical protein